METNSLSDLSRRHFISASLGAGAMVLAPGRLFAEDTGIVPAMIRGVGSEDRGYSTPPRYKRFWRVPAGISPSLLARMGSS